MQDELLKQGRLISRCIRRACTGPALLSGEKPTEARCGRCCRSMLVDRPENVCLAQFICWVSNEEKPTTAEHSLQFDTTSKSHVLVPSSSPTFLPPNPIHSPSLPVPARLLHPWKALRSMRATNKAPKLQLRSYAHVLKGRPSETSVRMQNTF